jgi:hypothetical protein
MIMSKLTDIARGLRVAAAEAYRIDPVAVQRRLTDLNNVEIQKEELRENGRFVRHRFAYIPIKQVQIPQVWSQEKLEAIRKEYAAGKPLFPVSASLDGNKYLIEDGIHRVNFSVEQGFTKVPAIIDEFANSFD